MNSTENLSNGRPRLFFYRNINILFLLPYKAFEIQQGDRNEHFESISHAVQGDRNEHFESISHAVHCSKNVNI